MKIWVVRVNGKINGERIEMQSVKGSSEAASKMVQQKIAGYTCYAEPDGSILAIDKVEYVPGEKQVRPFDNPDLKTKFHVTVTEIDKDIVYDHEMGDGYYIFDDDYSIYIEETSTTIEAFLVPKKNPEKKYPLGRYATKDVEMPQRVFYLVLDKALRLASNLPK